MKSDTPEVQALLKAVTDSLQSGKQFAVEQMPLLCNEILMYQRASYLLWFVVSIVGLYLCRKWCHSIDRRYPGDDVAAGPEACALILVAVISLVAAGVNANGLLKVWTAPRMVLLEELARYIK